VVQELRGEKIDIVPYDRDPARFVCNAIAPADVSRVIIDEANSAMELVVPDDKLSLAIGRRGQNVRLASQLTGWRLDVIGESKFKLMEEEAIAALASIENLDRNLALALYKAGFRSLDEVADAPEEELGAIDGLGGPRNAESLRARAESAMERRRLTRVTKAKAGDGAPLGDRELLQLVQGVTPRIADLLAHAGYRNVRDLAKEEDVDRLAIRTGLGMKKARMIQQGVQDYLREYADAVDAGQEQARARQAAADAETARQAAEAAAAASAASAAAAAVAAAANAAGAGDGVAKAQDGADGQ
jgi:N utilization substance protein A